MDAESGKDTGFESVVMGGNMPSKLHSSSQEGFYEALEKGTFFENLISEVRVVLHDGVFQEAS